MTWHGCDADSVRDMTRLDEMWEWRRSRNLVSRMRALARSAGDRPSSTFRSSWPTRRPIDEALNQPDGLLRSVAGRASPRPVHAQGMINEVSKASDAITVHVL